MFITPGFSGAAKRIVSLVAQRAQPENEISVMTFEKLAKKPGYLDDIFLVRNDAKDRSGLLHKIVAAYQRSQKIRNLANKKSLDTIVGFYKQAAVPVVLSSLLNSEARSIAAIRNNPRAKFNNFNGRITAFLYRFADKVVTNSKAAEKMCNDEFRIKNTTTIYNPVDYESIKNKLQQPLPKKYKYIFQNGQTFINIGRLSKQKGQWHLIRAFSKVVEENPGAILVILGQGELQEKLEKLIADCDIEKNVFLLGHQDNVFSFLKASDCFVLSSMHEGLPNVVLEAKAVGLPIISVDCDTGPREILAPDLSYNENISYPHEVGRHVIVEPLSGKQTSESAETKPLEPAEKLLAQTMKNKVVEGFEKKQFEHDERFDPERVIEQWVEIL